MTEVGRERGEGGGRFGTKMRCMHPSTRINKMNASPPSPTAMAMMGRDSCGLRRRRRLRERVTSASIQRVSDSHSELFGIVFRLKVCLISYHSSL